MDLGRQNLFGVHRGGKSSPTTIKSGAINCSRFLLDSRYHIFCPTPSELGDLDLEKNLNYFRDQYIRWQGSFKKVLKGKLIPAPCALQSADIVRLTLDWVSWMLYDLGWRLEYLFSRKRFFRYLRTIFHHNINNVESTQPVQNSLVQDTWLNQFAWSKPRNGPRNPW